MRTITTQDILTALALTDPGHLAAALYAARDPRLLDTLTGALAEATGRLADHPHADVIREADALLYDTLRWPVADALPTGHTLPGADELAAARGITTLEAQRLLDRIAATEADAARRLLDSGVEPNFTLEQAQVTACIRALLAAGTIPTRATVAAHATGLARNALRPSDGTEPLAYPADSRLAPRIISSSPMALVPLWITRMDADPPLTGLLDDRIAYLRDAKHAMGQASRAHAQLEPPRPAAVEHARAPGSSAPRPGSTHPSEPIHRLAG